MKYPYLNPVFQMLKQWTMNISKCPLCTENLILNISIYDIQIQIIIKFGTAKSINTYL